jgi:hypothetical protein
MAEADEKGAAASSAIRTMQKKATTNLTAHLTEQSLQTSVGRNSIHCRAG